MDNIILVIYSFLIDNPVTSLLLIVEIIAFVFLFGRYRQRKDYLLKTEQQQKNMRMALLTKTLSNPRWVKRNGEPEGKIMPYQTTWEEAVTDPTEGIPVELDVKSSRYERKYTFIIQDSISIGNDDSCSIALNDTLISPRHCSVYFEDGGLKLKKLSDEGMLILERGRDFKKLDKAPLAIMDGDEISLGQTKIKIRIFDEG